MLVLSRKHGQTVHVGRTITVTVLGVRGNSVKLGIEAPRDVRIMRGELPDWFEVSLPPTDEDARSHECPAMMPG